MTLEAPPPPTSTMRPDIVSAYLASGMKVISWAAVTMLMFTYHDARQFALFSLLRGTLSFLNYTTLGLAPAIIHALSRSAVPMAADVSVPTAMADGSDTLTYESAAVPKASKSSKPLDFEAAEVGYSSVALSVVLSVGGILVAIAYAQNAAWLHGLGAEYRKLSVAETALYLGIGLALRLSSDSLGAILQAFGRISADNLAAALADVIWILLMAGSAAAGDASAKAAAVAFAVSSVLLLIARAMMIPLLLGYTPARGKFFNAAIMKSLLWFGLLVSIAQLGDFLYAPTDYIIITRTLGLEQVAVYAPAVQIDGALLLIIAGLANVLLPKAAAASALGRRDHLRTFFIQGTLASTAMLLVSAVVVYFLSPWIFRIWLRDPMPLTQAILPLILIHTVVGGSSAVGRSILLGMGKVKPFTIAVLIAGVSNVILSYSFVRFGGLGLKGVVLGTICAVVGRCAIWQPWYVWKCLRESGKSEDS